VIPNRASAGHSDRAVAEVGADIAGAIADGAAVLDPQLAGAFTADPEEPTTLPGRAGAGHGDGAVAVGTVADFALAIVDHPAAVLDPQLAAAVKTDNEVGAAIPNRVSAGHDDRAFTVRVAADIAAVIFHRAAVPNIQRAGAGIADNQVSDNGPGVAISIGNDDRVATVDDFITPHRPRAQHQGQHGEHCHQKAIATLFALRTLGALGGHDQAAQALRPAKPVDLVHFYALPERRSSF